MIFILYAVIIAERAISFITFQFKECIKYLAINCALQTSCLLIWCQYEGPNGIFEVTFSQIGPFDLINWHQNDN